MGANTIDTVARFGWELAERGRTNVAVALEDLIIVVVRSGRGLLTTGQAAERLGIDVHTVENLIEQRTYVDLLCFLLLPFLEIELNRYTIGYRCIVPPTDILHSSMWNRIEAHLLELAQPHFDWE